MYHNTLILRAKVTKYTWPRGPHANGATKPRSGAIIEPPERVDWPTRAILCSPAIGQFDLIASLVSCVAPAPADSQASRLVLSSWLQVCEHK